MTSTETSVESNADRALTGLYKIHAADPLDGNIWQTASLAIEVIQAQQTEIEDLKEANKLWVPNNECGSGSTP